MSRYKAEVKTAERVVIIDALLKCNGNCTQAALYLEMDRRTMYRKLDGLDLLTYAARLRQVGAIGGTREKRRMANGA